jgi:hypothetical protein
VSLLLKSSLTGTKIISNYYNDFASLHHSDYDHNDPNAVPDTCQNKELAAPQSLELPSGKDKLKIVWTYTVKWEVIVQNPFRY